MFQPQQLLKTSVTEVTKMFNITEKNFNFEPCKDVTWTSLNVKKTSKKLLLWLHSTSFQLHLSDMVLLSGSPHLCVWLFATINTSTNYDMITHHMNRNVLLVGSG